MSTRAAVVRSVGLVLVLVPAAACGTAGPPPASTPATSPAASTPAASPAASTPSASPGPARSPGPSTSATAPAATDAAPPAALLGGLSGAVAAGQLGTFSWDGFVSDSPWIVGPSAGDVRATERLAITLDPDLAPITWQARWAPVTGGQAGDPVDGGSGSTSGIEVSPPATPGAWSLQLTAGFGVGRSATWYWRIEVAP